MVISIVFLFFGQNKLTLLRFINNASMVGLAYIVIGGFMYVYYGGFFRGIAYSFRNFFMSRGEQYAQEISKNMDEHDRPTQKKKLSFSKRLNYDDGKKHPPINWAFIINACIFFLGSLALAYIFY